MELFGRSFRKIYILYIRIVHLGDLMILRSALVLMILSASLTIPILAGDFNTIIQNQTIGIDVRDMENFIILTNPNLTNQTNSTNLTNLTSPTVGNTSIIGFDRRDMEEEDSIGFDRRDNSIGIDVRGMEEGDSIGFDRRGMEKANSIGSDDRDPDL